MVMMTKTEMVDMLDECSDEISGIRTILVALGIEFREQRALGVIAADLDEVALKIEAVIAQLELNDQ